MVSPTILQCETVTFDIENGYENGCLALPEKLRLGFFPSFIMKCIFFPFYHYGISLIIFLAIVGALRFMDYLELMF